MRLSKTSLQAVLVAVSRFDRERGIPHNYVDLEKVLAVMEFHPEDGVLEPGAEVEELVVLADRGDL